MISDYVNKINPNNFNLYIGLQDFEITNPKDIDISKDKTSQTLKGTFEKEYISRRRLLIYKNLTLFSKTFS